jgi:hypothetical protein
MAETNERVYVELYDAPITPKKDDRTGRVLSTGTASVDDLINDSVERGTDISPVTMRAVYELLKGAALKRVLRGQRVEFGLGVFHTEVSGTFTGDAAKWDPSKNHLIARTLPSKELRDALKHVGVEVLGMARTPNMIASVVDVVTGQENTCLTRNGMAHINGTHIRIAGSDPSTGLKVRLLPDGAVLDVPATAIGINDPSRVSFVVPGDLPAGEYELSIVTQYTGSKAELKAPRTVTLAYPLTVE